LHVLTVENQCGIDQVPAIADFAEQSNGISSSRVGHETIVTFTSQKNELLTQYGHRRAASAKSVNSSNRKQSATRS
jgi:hypothetical protein